MTTEERLENRERELAELRAGLAVGLTTRQVRIVDENGKDRAVLAALKDGPELTLLDENGKDRAGLSEDKDGTRLILLDAKGKMTWKAP